MNILKNEMLYQISNSFIHLKDAIIETEYDYFNEYNNACEKEKLNNKKIENNLLINIGNFQKKLYLNNNFNEINSLNESTFKNEEDFSIEKNNTYLFYRLNSNMYKNKSNLSSICNIKEFSSRLIRTLSKTQKILMIAAFLASELDSSKDSIILRGVKRTMMRKKRKVIYKY